MNEFSEDKTLEILGARENNLKNIDLSIPRNALVVITGISGSGKSSLAFDTIYAEGQRRYMESFSAYARQFIGNMERPDVDKITGLSPVISIEQKSVNKNPRSTVGTQKPALYCGHHHRNLRLFASALCPYWRGLFLQHRRKNGAIHRGANHRFDSERV